MRDCRWSPRVERWFDGESREPERVAQHVAECPGCAGLVNRLERWRKGARAVAEKAEIADAQFPAFLAGVREGIEAPERRRSGLWAVVSLTAAALLVALSVFAVFTGPGPAKAHTVVESAETEVEGATVETQDSTEDSSAVIWVHVPRRDVL
jgi:predicted anti-sigma-YlaC factor YlaD